MLGSNSEQVSGLKLAKKGWALVHLGCQNKIDYVAYKRNLFLTI